jgi:hypothetical protein
MFARLVSFLRLSISPVKTTPAPSAAEVAGAMPTQGGMLSLINSLVQNASPVFGNFLSRIYSGTTQQTYNALDMLGGVIKRYGLTGATTDSTDTATNIVNAMPGATVGQSFLMMIANLTSTGNLTVGVNAGITITGTASIQAGYARLYVGQVTGSGAVTLQNCFTFPASF